MTKIFALLIGGILAGILANSASGTRPAPVPVAEDTWAKQSAEDMKLAVTSIVLVNNCPLAASLMTDQDRVDAKALVAHAIERFGQYDVSMKALQLRDYMVSQNKMHLICSIGVWDR